MERYRNTLKRRTQLYGGLCGLVPVATFVTSWIAGNAAVPLNDHDQGFIHGFVLGFVVLMLGYFVYTMVKVQRALRDDAVLKQMYIAETDERRQFIQNKVGGAGMRLVVFLLCFAAVLACYFNITVTYTLVAAALGVALVMLGFKLYYRSRY